MSQRLINETAFNMTRILLGMIAHGAGEEDYRRQFQQVFETCRAGLEAYRQQIQRIQHQLRPLEKEHVPATAT